MSNILFQQWVSGENSQNFTMSSQQRWEENLLCLVELALGRDQEAPYELVCVLERKKENSSE
jgi:hypothetical protein